MQKLHTQRNEFDKVIELLGFRCRKALTSSTAHSAQVMHRPVTVWCSKPLPCLSRGPVSYVKGLIEVETDITNMINTDKDILNK